jgi:hypothetical protein
MRVPLAEDVPMRRATCWVLLLALLNGCIGWSNVRLPLEGSLSPERGPHKVRVLLLDSSSVTLRAAVTDARSVTGYHDVLSGRFLVIPLDSVRAIQKQRIRVGTFLLGGVVLLAVFANGFRGLLDGFSP